jgi:hypothetical protein
MRIAEIGAGEKRRVTDVPVLFVILGHPVTIGEVGIGGRRARETVLPAGTKEIGRNPRLPHIAPLPHGRNRRRSLDAPAPAGPDRKTRILLLGRGNQNRRNRGVLLLGDRNPKRRNLGDLLGGKSQRTVQHPRIPEGTGPRTPQPRRWD